MRKTSLLNRLLSLALCLCMVLSLLPASSLTAFAADSVSYIDRSWNGSEVTSTTKSVTDYTTVESSTTTMSSGWYVVKGNTTVQERITVTGDAHLILCDGASLVTIFGISVNSGNSLTVYGQENDSGSLAATGGSAYAGIGGDHTHGAGTITINGGTVSVNGSTYAACIGSAEFGIGGTVVINGGTVNANGHAGIGAGLNGTLDKIMINGGAVTACGSRGAGIGGVGANTLSNNGYTATIEINGGTVNATGVYGAGIGGGNLSGGTTDISITGGTVIAVCNEWGAGIGGGYGGTGTYNISITGGTVTARGQGSSAYGIGGGFGSEGTANVSISGGSINATSVQSTALSLVTVAVKGEGLEGKQVTSLTLSDGSSYGLNGVIVQDTDKVYLCLANGVTVTAIEIDYVNYLFAGENIFCNHPGYENATCISAGTCTGCGASNNIKDPNNHASTELKYTVNAADSTKHDAAYVCCGAVDRTESHTYESGVCKYCQVFCNHPTIGTDGICTICKQSGYKYLDRSWDNSNKTVISEIKTFIPDVMVSSSDTEWRSGWYAVAGNVTISSRITVTGDVKLVLLDGCTLNASNGVTVNEGNSLTIYGQTAGTGELLADTDPGSTNAGIGGGYNETGGVINIHGGVVNARAQGAGAGIGGGSRGAGGTITIYGGTVCATSGSTGYGGGAGIGGGYFGAGGKITIYGGMITATTTSTDDVSGAGIGSGFYDDGEMISIHGGTVNATSQGRGAGIGGGHVGAGGMVVITGGNVKAVSSKGPTVGGCKGGTLTDGNGNSVSEVVIALESAAADTAVTEVFGVTYGINDVITLDTNKLYLYLPSGSAPTYFTVGDTIYCSASGNNNYSSTTHSPGKDYTADGDVHYSNCTICGSICNKDVHSGGTPDCLNTGNCAVCGVEYLPIDPNTHAAEDTYIEYINDNYHGLYHACCKAQKEQIAHTPAEGQEATCVGVATCAECGIAYGGNDTTNHASDETKYISNGNGTHILTHACCGNPAAAPESHKVTYTVNGEFTIDAVCKDCGATGSATFAPTAGGTYNGCVFASSYSATGILNGWNAFTNPVITGCCEGGCKNAGEHTVTMTLGDQSVSATFTVARKTLTISEVEAHYKSYDGTSDLDIYSVSLDGVVVYDEGDYDGEWDDVRDDVKLVYDDLVYTLEDVVPGYYDTVNVSGVTITGSDASNYGIAESFEDVPLLDSMGYDFKIHNATVLIDVHDQLLTGDQEIDQNGYSIDGLEEQFTIEGISLYDNGYSQIEIDPYGISIYLDGEDVTDHFDINIYPGNLSRVCEGHEYDANGFCATGECRSYEPAVRMDEVDEWGSEVTYYDIYNAGQLYWFAEQVNTYGNNYINGRLMTDITVNEDLTAENLRQWTPIGKDWPTYCGVFEGNDYTISGLYVCDPEMDYVGLFGGTDYANSISNIHLTNSYFEGNSYIGGLFGYAGSNISGCTVSDSVTVKGNSYLGGIAGGTAYGELNNSWSAATVAANENGYSYGGLVGNNSLSINNCYTTESSLVGVNQASYGGSLNNSYYLSEEETEDGGKTAAQFASGEVAYLLNGSTSEGVWKQTLGTDAAPSFTGGTVYSVKNCKDESDYSNTNETIGHKWVDGICSVCDEVCGHDGGTATCTEKAVCDICGESYGELAAHTPDTNGKCTVDGCGYQHVAKVGDSFYETIHKALWAAEGINGCTLTLLDDVTLTSMSSYASYVNTGTFTLDLNGKTLSSNKRTLEVMGSADLTIRDSIGGGKIVSTDSGAVYLSGGKLTIESGTFEGALDGVFLSGTSTLIVKGGTFTGSRAMITGFGSNVEIDLTAIDPSGLTLKNNGSGTFAPKLPEGYSMVGSDGKLLSSLSAEQSATVHKHEYKYTDIGDGNHQQACSCGLTTGEPAAHSTTAEDDKAANCGSKAYCSVCESYYGEVDKTNHDSSVECENGFCPYCDAYEPAVLNGDVYEISNAGQLYWFAARVNGGENAINGKLMKDIVVNEGTMTAETTGARVWTPIGNSNVQYTGTFDGNGMTVSGLYFNDAAINWVGLFGYVREGGKVQNVGVVNAYFCGQHDVGGVIGWSYYDTIITGCYSTGTVIGRSYVGGVVGSGFGAVTNCYNTGTVSGDGDVGGVVGVAAGKVTNCYNTGTVSGDEDVGGVVGYIRSTSTVTNCYFNSDVYTGAAAGYNDGTVTSVEGKTTAQFASGEVAYLLGEAFGQNIDNGGENQGHPVFSDATVYRVLGKDGASDTYTNTDPCNPHDFEKCICPICGAREHQGSVSYENGFCPNCDAYEPAVLNGDVYEISNAGQLYWFAAKVNGGETAINGKLIADIVVNEGTMTAEATGARAWTPIGNRNVEYTGAFDGNDKTVSGLYFNDANAGTVGLFGHVGESGKVQNVGVANAYFSGRNYVGGVVGWNKGTVMNCYNTGTVSGNWYVGGVVGWNAGTVTNCYSTGTVSGNANVGGVMGFNAGTVTNCYNTSTVSCDANVGGVVGLNDGTVTNCCNTGTVSGNEEVGGVVGLNYGTATNCYFLSETEDSYDGTTAKTAEQFASGEVAYLLSLGATVGEGDSTVTYPGDIWGQTIGTEEIPTLGGSKVYQIANTGCSIYGEYSYSNDENGTYAPDHSFPEGCNGFCTNCDAYEPAVLNGEWYEISNAGQLYWFAQQVNSGNGNINGKLMADIVVNENVLAADGSLNQGDFRPWIMMGDPNRYLSGTFDGQGHTVSGLYCEHSSETEFITPAFITNVVGGTVRNVGLVDSYIRSSWNYAGGVVGGTHKATVENCWNEATVIAANGAGGIVGCAGTDTTVGNCYNTGTIISNERRAAGILVVAGSGITLKNCYNTGTVQGAEGSDPIANGDLTLENSYYLAESETDSHDGTTFKTAEAFASGEVAYLLQADQQSNIWGQTCGTGLPALGGPRVYAGYGDCQDTEFVYSNDPETLSGTPISHTYVNGFCTNTLIEGTLCGAYQEAQIVDGVYQICNAGQLFWFAQQVNDGNKGANAVLTADIDLEGRNWTPICSTGLYYNTTEYADTGYTGTFDGQGHVISDLTATGSAELDASYGLFGTLSGTVKNLGIRTFTYTGAGMDSRVGSVVGQMLDGSLVENCFAVNVNINTQVNTQNGVAGGIAGCNYAGIVRNCFTDNVTITAGRYGGILGDNCADGNDSDGTDRPGTMDNCYTSHIYLRDPKMLGNAPSGEAGVSAEWFASGEIAYLLGEAFGQNIDNGGENEGYPVFSDATVYKVIDCDGITEIYSNTNAIKNHIPNDDDGDCTTDVTCSVCGQVAIPGNAEHSWRDATCTTPKTCELCGTTEGEALGHKDEDNSGRCDLCNCLMQPALLRMVSISLKGNIALNYYMLLSDEVLSDSDAYMQFTMADGEIVKIPVSQGVQTVRSGETYYVFSCAVDAKEMTDDVISQFFYDGGSTKEHTYSVQTYAKHILENSDDEDMKALVKAMLHYGAASQIHFGYNTDNLANAGLEAPDYSDVTISGFNATPGQGTELAKFYSASLILKSETTLRFFFTAPITAAYNGQELEVKQRSGLYYVDVVGIAAKDLDENVTITINDGTNTADVTYNPMAYCAAVLNDSTGAFDQEMKDVVSALYLYNQAANIYFKEN